MKQSRVIQAMQALNALSAQALPLQAACAVHRLRAALRPAWEFQREEEEKLLSRLRPAWKGGEMQFSAPQDAQQYRDLLRDIGALEAEGNTLPEGFALRPVALSLSALTGVQLSADQVEALDGFVTFEEE